MTIISSVPGSGDAYAQLVEGLRQAFGFADIGALAERILETQAAAFHWDARVQEHYLGQHIGLELSSNEGSGEIARVAVLSFVAGRWHAGVCLVDGGGCAVDLLWARSFEQCEDAAEVFARAR